MKHFGMFENHNQMFKSFPQDLDLQNESAQIQKREDDKYVYYDVHVDGDSQKKLEVKVKDGQVFLSGQVEKKVKEGDSEASFTSSFQESLPVPEHTDPNKVEVQNEQGKVVLKFPKV